MGEPRRTTRFGALAALCIMGVLIATGCASSEAPPPTASSSPTAEKSDAAVLAAVLDVYTRYSAALDAILARGDGDYSQLEPLTTPEFFDSFTSADDEFSRGEWKTTGSTSFDSEELVSSSSSSVAVVLCRDVSRVRVVTVDGVDVTPADRSERFAVKVTFTSDDSGYLVDSSERTAEDALCG
ncbi:hypothetical protein CLV49_2214 [Labedella gwakjiensis]|uniref:Mce-associated membrane protein n=1 Tax=Labedella gwakjiensis TaxID=390269 RepID=A0A2P8GXA4_9MICO|nr:hypothetical protein [Labedella gwakjiensis]PSL38589.1 hypothetical protein CLV49_2214 [Labedella gwakjiensis]RUQ86906.1 hypothetical protein ELQ93_08150 [Labedella gwakjiensis]